MRTKAKLYPLVILVISMFYFTQTLAQDTTPDHVIGLNYSPFQERQSPSGTLPTSVQLRTDIQRLAEVTTSIRIHGMNYVDGGGYRDLGSEIVGLAQEYQISVLIQLDLRPDEGVRETEIERAVAAAQDFENVTAIIVGSNLISSGAMSAQEVIILIQEVRRRVPDTVFVGYADTLEMWQNHPDLADVTDVVGLNTSIFSSCTPPDEVGNHLLRQWNQITENPAYRGKEIFVFDEGLPTGGTHPTCPDVLLSPETQETVVRNLVIEITENAISGYLFQFADESWRCYTGEESDFGCQWGLLNPDRTPKGAWELLLEFSDPALRTELGQLIAEADSNLCRGAASEDMSAQSWEADLPTAVACVRNLSLWRTEAQQQQAIRLDDGNCNVQPSADDLEGYFAEAWALTDVAIGYFNLGLRLKEAGRVELARESFETLLGQYNCAWAWDPNGWFWSLSVGARNEMP